MTFKTTLKQALDAANHTTLDNYKVIGLSECDDGSITLTIETEQSDEGLVTSAGFAEQEVEIANNGDCVAKDEFGNACVFVFSMLRPLYASDIPSQQPEGNRLKSLFEGKA